MSNFSSLPSCVLITGATGGIGSALAKEYARAGVRTLILQGRDVGRLDALAEFCRSCGVRVVAQRQDVRDQVQWLAWLARISSVEAPDLVIANAGVNTHIDTQDGGWEALDTLIDVNIRAVFATVHGVLPAMRARGSGQIALVSSLAAWRGLPVTPGYSASKAAIKVFGEGLRGALVGTGIRVNVVMPGYVDSPMCTAMPGPKPFLWSADKAAHVIRRGLQADRLRISFPFPLTWSCFWLSVLPPALSGRILRRLGYGG